MCIKSLSSYHALSIAGFSQGVGNCVHVCVVTEQLKKFGCRRVVHFDILVYIFTFHTYDCYERIRLFNVQLLICIALSHLMQNEYGNTALHAASVKGHINIARFLVEKGATVNSLNKVKR